MNLEIHLCVVNQFEFAKQQLPKILKAGLISSVSLYCIPMHVFCPAVRHIRDRNSLQRHGRIIPKNSGREKKSKEITNPWKSFAFAIFLFWVESYPMLSCSATPKNQTLGINDRPISHMTRLPGKKRKEKGSFIDKSLALHPRERGVNASKSN